jgi:sigma-E factor negative regulatory protein RseC
MFVVAVNKCGAKQGDFVNIELEVKYFFKAVGIMYLIPLITLTLGFVLGQGLAPMLPFNLPGELAGFFTGLFFLALTYLGIKLFTKGLKKQMPVAVEIAQI